ncbi:MAG: inositol monophosphatase family protein [Aestuariivita sp.]|nr:inositol monophosphatase family protein [Aestuariivita sp.]MCY4203695.1 inositol monophosphatase family protein [Aestuariivita sp.]MCY4287027.1 inositol monophosphatase family protein [Aestuariivita sp.]MCY4347674.1 inositol monophosphatase family protein [Aestuariivita sp.]
MVGSANLNIMIKAARRVARVLVRDFSEVENLQVSMKGAGDFVSKADIAAEKILRKELMEARPTYGWVGEEGGETPGTDPTRRWLVDPLDGTTNFLHGLPHWGTSIALEHKGKIVSGVIFDPIKNELFFAEKGEGAWLNDKRIRVSARNLMIESIFATGLPFAGRAGLDESIDDLANLLPQCAGVRRFGAAALDLAYVAAGRYEGFWERGLQIWDLAAGLIILQEAGGLFEAINPEQSVLQDGSIIAANGSIFRQFSTTIRGAL